MLVLLLIANVVMADKIIYFGLSSQVASDVPNGVQVCYLDSATSMLQGINTELSHSQNNDPNMIASQYATQFQAISDSVLCQVQAEQLGITQLPAVVMNDEYVVYGQTSVTAAVQEIRGSMGAQHFG